MQLEHTSHATAKAGLGSAWQSHAVHSTQGSLAASARCQGRAMWTHLLIREGRVVIVVSVHWPAVLSDLHEAAC